MEIKGLKEAMELFDAKVVRGAVNATLNRIASMAKTEASRVIREKYNIKKSDIDDYMYIKKSTSAILESSLRVRARYGLAIYDFAARQTRGGVSFQVLKGNGRRTFRHAFFATMSSGHTGVFARKRGEFSMVMNSKTGRMVKKTKINELFTADPVSMMKKAGTEAVKKMADENLDRIFDGNLKFYSSKFYSNKRGQ